MVMPELVDGEHRPWSGEDAPSSVDVGEPVDPDAEALAGGVVVGAEHAPQVARCIRNANAVVAARTIVPIDSTTSVVGASS